MATHDYDIANQSGAAFRTDLNNVLDAIQSNNSNSSSPATTVAYQWWADTNAAIMKIRNSSNNAWINLFTLAGGIDVDAASNFNEDVTFTGASANIVFDKSDNALEFADNAKATFGTGGDLTINHNGTSNFFDSANGAIVFRTAGNDNQIFMNPNGSVEIYFDGSKKLETQNLGVNINGNLDLNDNDKVRLGTASDLQIFHNATNSFISNTTGILQIDSDDTVQVNGPELRVKNAGDTETIAKFMQNSECQLFFDNAEKLNTSSGGVFVHGTIGSQPPDKDTRGMSLSSYVVDINQADQTVATAKINSNKGVCLDLNRFYTTGNIVEFRINNDFEGNIVVSSTGVSYNTTSDYRLKENVVALSDGITRFKQLKPYRFNFIAEPSVLHDGFFAHEVSSIVPSAVSGEKDATQIRYYEEGDILPSGKVIGDIKDENSVVPQSLDYAKIVPLITAALQESIAKIEVLETKVAALEAA